MLHAVKVYGVGRCPGTRRAVALLDAMGVRYDYFDLDADRHAAAWVRWTNGGAAAPTVLVGLTVLADPTEPELKAALANAQLGLRAAPVRGMKRPAPLP